MHVFATCRTNTKHAHRNRVYWKKNSSFNEHGDLPDVFTDYWHDSQHGLLSVVTDSAELWPDSGVHSDCQYFSFKREVHTDTQRIYLDSTFDCFWETSNTKCVRLSYSEMEIMCF